jgi:hypothetical protein
MVEDATNAIAASAPTTVASRLTTRMTTSRNATTIHVVLRIMSRLLFPNIVSRTKRTTSSPRFKTIPVAIPLNSSSPRKHSLVAV